MGLKFQKKPIAIEAIQFTGDKSYDAMCAQWGDDFKKMTFVQPSTGYFMIQTSSGSATCNEGDWVIKGVKDEFYPCPQAIFDASYDEVE